MGESEEGCGWLIGAFEVLFSERDVVGLEMKDLVEERACARKKPQKFKLRFDHNILERKWSILLQKMVSIQITIFKQQGILRFDIIYAYFLRNLRIILSTFQFFQENDE